MTTTTPFNNEGGNGEGDNSAQSGDPTFADLVGNRNDLMGLRNDFYKPLAKDIRDSTGKSCPVEDLLPLTTTNDTAYITGSNMDFAEWFADIYEKEGRPKIHPRGMHYRILGKGYDRKKGEPYGNDNSSWMDMAKGAYWSQLLGLVPANRILDEKNAAPEGPHVSVNSRTGEVTARATRQGEPETNIGPSNYESPKSHYERPLPPTTPSEAALHNDVDDLIEQTANRIADSVFDGVSPMNAKQGYYFEVWAEKSGLIPDDVRTNYRATTRPAGGGEFSYDMCRNAVEIATARGQDLVVVLITDFDPKGKDMPKSASRKIEVEAAMHGIDAHVHHAALTEEQLNRYGLPTTPAATASGDPVSAAGYETHKSTFGAATGTDPSEVNAFAEREPEAFEDAIESCIEPYYDDGLYRRTVSAINNAKDDLVDDLTEWLTNEGDIEQAHAELTESIETYNERVDDAEPDGFADILEDFQADVESIRDDVDLDSQRDELDDAMEVTPQDVLEGFEVDLPSAKTEGRDDGVLDTRRPLLEQVEAYNESDVRYE